MIRNPSFEPPYEFIVKIRPESRAFLFKIRKFIARKGKPSCPEVIESLRYQDKLAFSLKPVSWAYVIPSLLDVAATLNRLLDGKLGGLKILLAGEFLGNLHSIDKPSVPRTSPKVRSTSAYNPVTLFC
jgi:hypothetical protein